MHIPNRGWLIGLTVLLLLLVSCNKDSDYSLPEEFLVRAYEVLEDYSYYREHIPATAFQSNTPAELYYSIPDTLHGGQYTFFVESFDVNDYLGKFSVGDTKYYFGMLLDVLRSNTADGGDTLFCSQVFHGSSAEQAGLKVGDKIVAIDSFPLFGNRAVFDAVTSHSNDTVSVRFVLATDAGLDTITVFKGDRGAPVSYSAQLTEQVGYIYLSTFLADSTTAGGSSSAQFARSLEETKHFPVTVIDLRGNGGGYVSQADTIASYFLDAGDTVIVTHAPAPNVYRDMEPTVTTSSPIVGSRKFVLLADGRSASASEILITALKHNTDMPLVGKKTYGKAIGQLQIYLRDVQSEQILGISHLTVAAYFAPDGSKYAEVGIKPDVEVGSEITAFEDPQLAKAIDVAEGILGISTHSKRSAGYGASIANYNERLPRPQVVYEIESKVCDF